MFLYVLVQVNDSNSTDKMCFLILFFRLNPLASNTIFYLIYLQTVFGCKTNEVKRWISG